MLLDANVLLYAEDADSAFHEVCKGWLEPKLAGGVRVGFPWPTLLSFVRIRTSPRVYPTPLTGRQAWDHVTDWLAAPGAWIPAPTDRHAALLGGLVGRYHLSAKAIPDAHLAALAMEHGLPVASADAGFARFEEIRWISPLRS